MKKRNIIITGSVLAVVIVGLIGGWLWHNHQHHKKPVTSAQTVGNHLISLDQSTQAADSGGLSVSGQAGSLGQLNGDSKQSQNSSSKSSSDDLDPASFSQYDKYQGEQNALVGELQTGSGSVLAVGQKANIYYKVWLTNGTLVDQSPVSASGQKQPFGFTLGAHQVILGLEQGVVGMKVGGKRLIIVPPLVGYGAQGQGNIPANAVLVFEVQLVSTQ